MIASASLSKDFLRNMPFLSRKIILVQLAIDIQLAMNQLVGGIPSKACVYEVSVEAYIINVPMWLISLFGYMFCLLGFCIFLKLGYYVAYNILCLFFFTVTSGR